MYENFTEKDKKNAPVLSLTESNIDLGEIPAGEVRICRINYRNTGSDTLRIRAVRNACDCISIRIDTPAVAPGAEGTITAIFNSEGRSGKQERYLTIISNSPTTQQVVCKLSGVVK